jgi:hypothetical protein
MALGKNGSDTIANFEQSDICPYSLNNSTSVWLSVITTKQCGLPLT